MATRLEESNLPSHSLWQVIGSIITPALAVGAVIIYTSVSISHGHFYHQLGTSANDVGLSYVNSLAGATGFALVMIFLITPLFGVQVTAIVVSPKEWPLISILTLSLTITVLVVILVPSRPLRTVIAFAIAAATGFTMAHVLHVLEVRHYGSKAYDMAPPFLRRPNRTTIATLLIAGIIAQTTLLTIDAERAARAVQRAQPVAAGSIGPL